MKIPQQFMEALSRRYVFEPVERPIFAMGDVTAADVARVMNSRPGFDDQAVEKRYRQLVDAYQKAGYEVAEVDADQTDGYKGKQYGNRLLIYEGLPVVEKLIVLDHEGTESYLMGQTGKSDNELHPEVQRMAESKFGPGGDLECMPAYRALAKSGRSAGSRSVFGD